MTLSRGVSEEVMLDRRALLSGLAASIGLAPGLARAAFRPDPWPGCALDLSRAPVRTPADWDRIYERYWGPLGSHGRDQIDNIIHAKNGVYDDSEAVFAWIVHYWLRAFVVMADLTGEARYMDSAVSFIDVILDNTDEKRVARGEISGGYVRDPLYLRRSGRGGPFWKRGDWASVLDTGQVIRGLMAFVDAVYRAPVRWAAYRAVADRAFAAAIRAADAFDNDWQVIGDTGAYHYRDSQGSGQLGTTRTAFNQSATMAAAQLMIHAWRPDPGRLDKVRRLVRHWLADYAVEMPDGALTWRYILIPSNTDPEDAGHATIDLNFLVAAFLSGRTDLTSIHMAGLAQTFRTRLYDGGTGLNRFVDGTTDADYAEHFNAGFGWFDLARFDPKIAEIALTIYSAHYPPDAPGGTLWARPMLGWANLLRAGRACAG